MNDSRVALLEEKIAHLEQELDTSLGILETASSIIIRCTKDGKIRYINEFGSRFFGYAAEELLGQNVMILVSEVEQSTGRDMVTLVTDILNHPERHKLVPSENITRDGRTVWVSWANKAILDEQGAVQEILAIGNDITELKEVEQILKEVLPLNKLIIENSPIGLLVFKESGPCVMANPAAEKISGDSREKLLKLNYRETESYRKTGILAGIEESLRTDRTINKEIHSENTYGQEVWYEGTISTFKIDQEKHILFLFNDIMERKQVEQDLIKKKQQLDMVLEGSRDGYWDWNIETGDLYMSPQWHKQLGYEIGDIAPTIETLRAICHPDDYPLVMEIIQLHLDHKIDKPYEVEHRFKTKIGDWKWILARGKVFTDEKDNPVRMIGTATDISHRKHAEAERERLISELKNALDEVKTLRGIIPICSYCKKIRSDEGAWDIFEAYISEHTDAQFSHGICPNCLDAQMKQFDKKY